MSKATMPRPLVFSGPSGVGKGTLIKLLMDSYPSIFGFSVSHTTRAPRPGEENGIHYHFVEKSVMEKAVERNEFVEYAHVHSNMYGTSVKAIETVQSMGKICILDIDIQGVRKVKESTLECKYIFILPPSMAILEERLKGRGTETEEKISLRLHNAHTEMEYGNIPGNFDALVVNNELSVALENILGFLKDWYPAVDFSLRDR